VTLFTDADLRELERRGIAEDEVRRQLAFFARPPSYRRLERPCTVGDGIRRLDPADHDDLLGEHAAQARLGRLLKFVPASGAASRMFKELLHYHQGPGRGTAPSEVDEHAAAGRAEALALRRFLDSLERFAFHDELRAALELRGTDLSRLRGAGEFAPLLDALLSAEGLAYADTPKGLIRFHAYPDGECRTALEEHLAEAARITRDAEGRCRLHFTVSPEHRERFEQAVAEAQERYGRRHDCRFEVSYSSQKAATDTIAADTAGRPLRDADGALRFRPGGHGALIENLADLAGDLVFIKNIDNVQPERRRGDTLLWKALLAGILARLERRAHERVRDLRSGAAGAVEAALRFVVDELGLVADGSSDREALLARLDRPLRVCGVVPNTGEPGGGPFWVRGADGRLSLQIVEAAEVDPDDAEQQALLRGSTHFNPVDLVCALRDADGRPHDLHRFIDPDAVMISRKSADGHELLALERPGLWNGAMAGWNTVFVEVPLATFSPVKSVLDLLREEHDGR